MGWPWETAAGLAGSLDIRLVTPFMSTNGDSKDSGSTGEQEKPLNLPQLPGLNFYPMSVVYKEI